LKCFKIARQEVTRIRSLTRVSTRTGAIQFSCPESIGTQQSDDDSYLCGAGE